ncbi:MAG: hypothetical protein M3O50_19715 [Myxococcota bacterium]|nr:hypothetical protein [Myxococcota bacterium]
MPLLENARLACAVGAEPKEVLVTELASAAPGTLGDLMAQLRSHASSLKRHVDRGAILEGRSVGHGHSLALAPVAEQALRARKGLAMDSAGVPGAVMRDMGFLPDAAAAFCTLYFGGS